MPCIGPKVDECVRLAKEGLAGGLSVVIGLQTTGEAQTTAHLARGGGREGQGQGWVSPAKEVRDLTAWTVHQDDGPNHLGLRCNALPGHQTALLTSGCGPSRCCGR